MDNNEISIIIILDNKYHILKYCPLGNLVSISPACKTREEAMEKYGEEKFVSLFSIRRLARTDKGAPPK